MVKIYLDLDDGSREDPYFYLAPHVDKDDRMRDTYISHVSGYASWGASSTTLYKERKK